MVVVAIRIIIGISIGVPVAEKVLVSLAISAVVVVVAVVVVIGCWFLVLISKSLTLIILAEARSTSTPALVVGFILCWFRGWSLLRLLLLHLSVACVLISTIRVSGLSLLAIASVLISLSLLLFPSLESRAIRMVCFNDRSHTRKSLFRMLVSTVGELLGVPLGRILLLCSVIISLTGIV